MILLKGKYIQQKIAVYVFFFIKLDVALNELYTILKKSTIMRIKQTISTLFIATVLLTSCQQTNQDLVEDLMKAANSFDNSKIDLLLADNFIFSEKTKFLNKKEYLIQLDSLKNIELKSDIIVIQDMDSIVKTEEKITNIIDSLLEVTPKLVQRKTYRFKEGKIENITVDTYLNYDEYNKSYNDKLIPFAFYVKYHLDIQDEKEMYKNIKKYLTEYVALPQSEKKKFLMYASLQGTYISNSSIYKKLIFTGKRTVTIVDAIFGYPFATSYEIDEQFIKIKTDKSDLIFEFKDSKTLLGEGWAAGTYLKSN